MNEEVLLIAIILHTRYDITRNVLPSTKTNLAVETSSIPLHLILPTKSLYEVIDKWPCLDDHHLDNLLFTNPLDVYSEQNRPLNFHLTDATSNYFENSENSTHSDRGVLCKQC
jgi:hypothetical protein